MERVNNQNHENRNTKSCFLFKQPEILLEYGTVILFFLLCILFIALGLNHMVYPPLYTAAVLSLFLLLLLQRYGEFSIRVLAPLFPFGILLYTAVTPGYWFKDLPLATMMGSAYIAGLAAQCLLKEKIHFLYLYLSLTLSACFLYHTVFGFSNLDSNPDKLKLLFYHNNVMALVTVWCVIYLVFNIKNFFGHLRLVAWTSVLINVLIFMLSGGRSAYIGCIASVLLMGIFFYRGRLLYIMLCLLLLSVATYMVLPENEGSRIRSLIQNPICDPTFQSRLPIWEVAMNGIAASPVLGNSLRGFYDYDQSYKKAHLNEMKTRYSIIETSVGHPHNIYLGILFMSGFAGGLLWLLAYLPAVRAAVRQQDMFFLCFLLFYLFYGLSDFSLHRKDGAVTLFFPLGMVYGQFLMDFCTDSKAGVVE